MSTTRITALYNRTHLSESCVKFLNKLDTGAVDYLTGPNRFIPSMAENTPVASDRTKILNVVARDVALIEIKVHVWARNVVPPAAMARLNLIGLSLFYNPVSQANPMYKVYFGGYLILLRSYIDANSMENAELCAEAKNRGFEIRFIYHSTIESLDAILQALGGTDILTRMGYSPDVDENSVNLQILACCMFPLMAKRLTNVSIKRWFEARLRSFGQILGKQAYDAKTQHPLLDPCVALNTFFGSHHSLRAVVFRAIRSLASGQGLINSLMARVCGLLRWAEMSHIWLIQKCILEQHPEILCFSGLSSNAISSFRVAVDLISSYPAEDRAFLKLLYPQDVLRPLQAANHKFLIAAAHIIASRYSTSLANLNIGAAADVKEFTTWVSNYITMKQEATARVVARAGLTLAADEDTDYMMKLATSIVRENPLGGEVELRI